MSDYCFIARRPNACSFGRIVLVNVRARSYRKAVLLACAQVRKEFGKVARQGFCLSEVK